MFQRLYAYLRGVGRCLLCSFRRTPITNAMTLLLSVAIPVKKGLCLSTMFFRYCGVCKRRLIVTPFHPPHLMQHISIAVHSIIQDYDVFVRRNMERGYNARDMNVPFLKEQAIKFDIVKVTTARGVVSFRILLHFGRCSFSDVAVPLGTIRLHLRQKMAVDRGRFWSQLFISAGFSRTRVLGAISFL